MTSGRRQSSMRGLPMSGLPHSAIYGARCLFDHIGEQIGGVDRAFSPDGPMGFRVAFLDLVHGAN